MRLDIVANCSGVSIAFVCSIEFGPRHRMHECGYIKGVLGSQRAGLILWHVVNEESCHLSKANSYHRRLTTMECGEYGIAVCHSGTK
jgi:hypothetical protein